MQICRGAPPVCRWPAMNPFGRDTDGCRSIVKGQSVAGRAIGKWMPKPLPEPLRRKRFSGDLGDLDIIPVLLDQRQVHIHDLINRSSRLPWTRFEDRSWENRERSSSKSPPCFHGQKNTFPLPRGGLSMVVAGLCSGTAGLLGRRDRRPRRRGGGPPEAYERPRWLLFAPAARSDCPRHRTNPHTSSAPGWTGSGM